MSPLSSMLSALCACHILWLILFWNSKLCLKIQHLNNCQINVKVDLKDSDWFLVLFSKCQIIAWVKRFIKIVLNLNWNYWAAECHELVLQFILLRTMYKNNSTTLELYFRTAISEQDKKRRLNQLDHNPTYNCSWILQQKVYSLNRKITFRCLHEVG